MQNQNPMSPAPNVAEPSKGFFASMSLWNKIKLIGIGIFFVGVLGFYFVIMRKVGANVVLFVNSLDAPGELALNGKSYGSIAPKQPLRVELDPGSYTLTFTGGGGSLDQGTLLVPATKAGDTVGFRALYNLGGKKGMAVATKYYGGNMKNRIEPVAEGTRLVPLENVNVDRIDDTFPASVSVPKKAPYGTVIRVCRLDEQNDKLGCPGW